MPDNNITDLLQRSAISFTGTVERLGVSNVPELSTIDDHTGVVLVDRVLHSPPAFAHLAGTQVTVQFSADAGLPAVGQRFAFFANGLVFGADLAVMERDATRMRGGRPFVFTNLKAGDAVDAVVDFIVTQGGL